MLVHNYYKKLTKMEVLMTDERWLGPEVKSHLPRCITSPNTQIPIPATWVDCFCIAGTAVGKRSLHFTESPRIACTVSMTGLQSILKCFQQILEYGVGTNLWTILILALVAIVFRKWQWVQSLSLWVSKRLFSNITVSWFAFFYQEWHFSFSSSFRRRYF